MRYVFLDVVRSVAIALLLIAHVAQAIGSPVGDFFCIQGIYYVSIGGVALTIFLILSGMVLALQYNKQSISYLSFVFNRGLKIYPIYYMSLFIGFVLYFNHEYKHSTEFTAVFSSLNFSDVVLSLTGLYAFVGDWGGPFVPTSWFIGLIMSMY